MGKDTTAFLAALYSDCSHRGRQMVPDLFILPFRWKEPQPAISNFPCLTLECLIWTLEVPDQTRLRQGIFEFEKKRGVKSWQKFPQGFWQPSPFQVRIYWNLPRGSVELFPLPPPFSPLFILIPPLLQHPPKCTGDMNLFFTHCYCQSKEMTISSRSSPCFWGERKI